MGDVRDRAKLGGQHADADTGDGPLAEVGKSAGKGSSSGGRRGPSLEMLFTPLWPISALIAAKGMNGSRFRIAPCGAFLSTPVGGHDPLGQGVR